MARVWESCRRNCVTEKDKRVWRIMNALWRVISQRGQKVKGRKRHGNARYLTQGSGSPLLIGSSKYRSCKKKKKENSDIGAPLFSMPFSRNGLLHRIIRAIFTMARALLERVKYFSLRSTSLPQVHAFYLQVSYFPSFSIEEFSIASS